MCVVGCVMWVNGTCDILEPTLATSIAYIDLSELTVDLDKC